MSSAAEPGRIVPGYAPQRIDTRCAAASGAAQALVWLVVTVMISAVGLGVWRFRRIEMNRQWLAERGASYDWQHQVPDPTRVSWHRTQAWLVHFLSPSLVSDFCSVKIVKDDPSDEQLAHLSKLRSLRTLILDSNQVTDQSVKRISGLRNLRSLSLSGPQITFTGLLELRKLPLLRQVNLRNMQLSMAELAVLETALPQANLKYNQDPSGATYVRQVVSRFPSVIPQQPNQSARFESLIHVRPEKATGAAESTVDNVGTAHGTDDKMTMRAALIHGPAATIADL